MGAGSVRASKAFLEIVGRENIAPAVAKAKAVLAGFAAYAKRLGGPAIASPIPEAATKAAAAAKATAANQARRQASVSKGAVEAAPAAMKELAASLKAVGEAGKIASGSMRGMAAVASSVSTSAVTFQRAFEVMLPSIRAMSGQVRAFGRAADRIASGLAISRASLKSPPPPTTPAPAPKTPSPLSPTHGGIDAPFRAPTRERNSAALLGAAWRAAGVEIRTVGSALSATGLGIERVGRFARSVAFDVTRLGLSIKFAGLATIGFLGVAVRTFTSAGSAAYDMSQRLGISTEAWSELAFAAQQAGATTESLELSLRKMQDTVIQAAVGSESASRSLAAMGLSAAQLVGLAPERQLELVAEGMASIADPAARTAIALDVFGRNAGRLLPLLTGGAAGIALAREEARRLGITISSVEAATADRLGDSLSALGALAKRAFSAVGAAIEPTISRGVALATTAVGGAIDWIRANTGVVVSVAAIGAGLVAAGALLVSFAPLVAAAASGVVALGTVVGLAGSAVGALATPLGLVGAAAATALAAMASLTGAFAGLGDSVAVAALGGLQAMRRTAVETVAGIVAALESGDTESAARLLWKGVELVWREGSNTVADIWDDLMDRLPASWDQVINRMAKGVTVIEDALTSLWEKAKHESANELGTAITKIEHDPKSILHGLPGGTALYWMLEADRLTHPNGEQLGTSPNQSIVDQIADESASRSLLPGEDRIAEIDARLKALDDDYGRAGENARQGREAARAARDAEAARLERELKDLRQASEFGRLMRSWFGAATGSTAGTADPRSSLADVIGKLTGGQAAARERLAESSVGTFAGSRASGLGSGAVERMSRATERTAKNTEQIADVLRVLQGLDLSFGEG